MGKVYTISQVAEILGVTSRTVRRWISKGVLKPDVIIPSGRKGFSEEYIKGIVNFDGSSTEDIVEENKIFLSRLKKILKTDENGALKFCVVFTEIMLNSRPFGLGKNLEEAVRRTKQIYD